MRRFYQRADILPSDGAYGLALDGKPVKTPAKRHLTVPTAALAQAIAAEWNAQVGDIRPSEMTLTQIANTALDRVGPHRALVVRQIAEYAGTDLVCYRATRPPELSARQQAVWQPLVDWTVLRYDAPLEITAGVIPVPQPAASLQALATAVGEHDDYTLAALMVATTACGSLVIALALAERRIAAGEAFAASQLDESFQIQAWGEDSEQTQRRRALANDIAAAARFLSLLRG
jgi:chaperone required for assembly of F1-ATPase